MERSVRYIAFFVILIHVAPAAVIKEKTDYIPNDMSAVIRREIQTGIREEVNKHLQRITQQEKQLADSEYVELLTDLKELVRGYDDKSKSIVGNTVGLRSTSCSNLRIISEKVDNLTASVVNYRAAAATSAPSQQFQARSCSDLRASGQTSNGVYIVHPTGWGPLEVYCDMITDGGGWMVFQRRVNASIDFYRGWLEYVNGFGDVDSSYWLGLRPLHHVTHNERQELRVHLADFDGNSRHAVYDFFAVSSEYTKFRMDLGSYSGDAGDGLEHSRDHRFSTKDVDNDNHPNEHCATRYTGGWWYNSCYRANLNGQYFSGTHRLNQGITWNAWRGDSYSLKSTIMMLRPFHFTP